MLVRTLRLGDTPIWPPRVGFNSTEASYLSVRA
jgi:hypothetical protein